MFRILCVYILLFFSLYGCCRISKEIRPNIESRVHPKEFFREKRIKVCLPQDFSVTPFVPLTSEEKQTDWGKEYGIGLLFAEDFDLYRAITSFKRALYLIPEDNKSRKQEIEYVTALAYYLGKKYIEVIYVIETTDLSEVDRNFPAFSDLLLILYDSYEQVGKREKANHILSLIENDDHNRADKLSLLHTIKKADLDEMSRSESCQNILCGYKRERKSICKAQTLNAIVPGAGYWYVGLKQTAFTAFCVNALFIGAATHFITHGNEAAGIITLSLEGGWYFGGIIGAGLAAKQYNDKIYSCYANKVIDRECLCPAIMLKYSF